MERDYQNQRNYQIRDDLYQDFKTAFELLWELGVEVPVTDYLWGRY
jgi:hypothetical protein